jgi:hypothetical protein
MSRAPSRPPATSLMVKLGTWFEAQATGWGVLAIPLILFGLLLMGVLTRG